MSVTYRLANTNDAVLLAPLNAQLIREEGRRDALTEPELKKRMETWLSKDHQAVVFESGLDVVGYALYRFDSESVFLKHLFVSSEHQREGIAQNALDWMKSHVWKDKSRIRIEVLTANKRAIAFWKTVGFEDYCLSMEFEKNSPAGGDRPHVFSPHP